MTLALVMLGAAGGAWARWAVDRFIFGVRGGFPMGTFTINMLGSVLLGFTYGAAVPNSLYALLGTGVAGGFTTFSTFTFETVRLAQGGSSRTASLYVVASVAAGMVMGVVGWILGDLLF